MKTGLICLLLGFLLPGWLSAQRARFINFSSRDGLHEKAIYHAVQDNQGYLWLGTITGLHRYDGHKFTHVDSPLNRPESTINNILNATGIDDRGNLWLGSANALQWYDPAHHRFWSGSVQDPTFRKVMNSGMVNIKPGKPATMLIATLRDYFFVYNRSDSSVHHFHHYPPTASKATFNVFFTRGGYLSIHQEGLYQFDQNRRLINIFPSPVSDITNGYLDEATNSLWLTTLTRGILRFDLDTREFDDHFYANAELKKHHLFCLLKTADGGFYIGGYPLHYVHPEKKIHHYFQVEGPDEYDISANKIGSIFMDREKNIWFSGTGLSMLPWQNQQIQTVNLVDTERPLAVEPLRVFSVNETHEYLMTNTNTEGLLYYHPGNKSFKIIPNPENKKPLKSGFKAVDGTLFFSDDQHVFRYNSLQQLLVRMQLLDQHHQPVLPSGNYTLGLKGEIYFESLRRGFYVWHYPGSEVEHFNLSDLYPSGHDELENKLSPVCTDSQGRVWLASPHGPFIYLAEQNKLYPLVLPDQTFIPATADILEDKQGHLWMSTYSNGLYEYWTCGDSIFILNHNRNSGSGLLGDYCSYLELDPVDSMLWINNSGILLKFNPYTRQVLRYFTKQNGLIEDGSEYRFNITEDNKLIKLFFAGFNSIDLHQYKLNNTEPVIQFNMVKVFNRDYRYVLPDLNDQLILSPEQNYLQFNYTTLVFNNGDRNQYAHQLAGLEPEWNYTGGNHQVAYAGLKPGRYIFKVKAANNDGLWGSEKSIHIRIKPPFYQTWWFILLTLLFLTALIIIVNRYLVHTARKQEQLKSGFQKLLAETEMKALRAQMNPHFIFNALNSIQKYILKEQHEEASLYLTKFSKLIRLILDHSHQNTIALNGELDLLRLYIELEALRFDQRFTYTIDVYERLQIDTIKVPSMLIQPYVENAIWHGLLHRPDPGHLAIQIKHQEEQLMVIIDDNGIGRARALEIKKTSGINKTSYGLRLAEDRLTIINRLHNLRAEANLIDKINAAGEALGTTVIITFPLN